MDLIREISGDVTAAAAALAGLLLVFLGSIATAYDSYAPEHQHAVRREYRIRVWFAFAGFLVALISTSLSLAGKLFARPDMITWAVILLALALLATGVAALITALDVK